MSKNSPNAAEDDEQCKDSDSSEVSLELVSRADSVSVKCIEVDKQADQCLKLESSSEFEEDDS